MRSLLLLLFVLFPAADFAEGQENPPANSAGGAWSAPRYGLRMTLPATWRSREAELQGEAFRAEFERDGRDEERLALRLFASDQVGGAEGARQLSVRSVEGSADYSDPILAELPFSGEAVAALTLDVLRDSPTLRLRHLYLEHAGYVLVIESVAPSDEFERRWPEHLELWESLELFEPEPAEATPADAERARLESLAARCGQDVRWASSWEEAAARGRAEGKPVLVCLRAYRGFQITDPNLSGVFMEPAWIDLLNARTVPLLRSSTGGLPFESFDSYGLSSTTFGATWLLVTPEGEVVADHPYPQYPAFVEALDAVEGYPGEAVPGEGTPAERARAFAGRGELDRARALLGRGVDDPLLPVELARRERDGERMLELIAEQERQGRSSALGFDLGVQRVRALAGLGRAGAAAEALDALAETFDGGATAEQRGTLALLDARLRWCAGDFDGARAALLRATEVAPDGPEGAIAAATLLSTSWQVQVKPRLAWLDPRDTAELRPATPEPLPLDEVGRAREQALTWLLNAQRPDGLWFEPAAAGRSAGAPPHDFQLATSALALRALLRVPASPQVEAALERGTAGVLAGWEAQRADEEAVFFMDYAVWSRACLLDLLADLAVNERIPLEHAGELASIAFDELVSRVQPNGGWSYYLTTDLSASSTAAQSISFTTAAVTLGLLHAREVGLLDGDAVDTVVESALDQLERMRDDDGEFAYMQSPGADDPGDVSSSGAAGRGPVCTLALLRGGRVEAEALERALYRFSLHRAAYAREVGRALMHTGREGEGSHYLTWDYAMAAEAAEALGGAEALRYRDPILEELLRARLSDGAFLGSPLIGRAHGTAEALRAFTSLEASARE